MRKVTRETVKAFLEGREKSVGNTHTDGKALYLHGNRIAWKVRLCDSPPEFVVIDNCGWHTRTTCERINGIFDALGLNEHGVGLTQGVMHFRIDAGDAVPFTEPYVIFHRTRALRTYSSLPEHNTREVA